MFVQASIVALAGNLLFLWLFGKSVEDAMGPLRFVAFYLAGGRGPRGAGRGRAACPEATVGAAGAVAALIGGHVVLYPRARFLTLVLILFFFGVIEIPVPAMVAVWVAMQAAFAATGLIGPSDAAAYSTRRRSGARRGDGPAVATRRKPTPPTAAAYR